MKHEVSAIRTKPLRNLITIRHCDHIDPGSDVFHTKEGEAVRLGEGIGRAPVHALPDHVGVCEIVDVGLGVENVKQGDFAMIDFYEVKQPYMVDGENLFICESEAIRCTLEPKTGIVHPLPDYILTKQAPERMNAAVTGSELMLLTPSQISSGLWGHTIWSDRQQKEVVCMLITYEEVVELGSAVADYGCKVGDLVVVVTDFTMKMRAMGGLHLRVGKPGLAVLGVVDEKAVLRDAKKRRATDGAKKWKARNLPNLITGV